MPPNMKEDPRIKCVVGDYPVSEYTINGCNTRRIELDERRPDCPWMVVTIENGQYISGMFPCFETSKEAVNWVEDKMCD